MSVHVGILLTLNVNVLLLLWIMDLEVAMFYISFIIICKYDHHGVDAFILPEETNMSIA